MCCRCCGVLQQQIWVFALGAIFLVSGILTTIWWKDSITQLVADELALSPCSRTFEMWEVTPMPIYNYMYLFNWTNTKDAHNPNIKPNFEQVGPYVFREEKVKDDITWYANKTVAFKANRTWYFEPEMSNGNLDDLVTCPHLPSIAAANMIRDEPKLTKILFNRALNSNGGALYQTHTAIEWLYDGFYDEFLDYAMHQDNPKTAAITSDHFAWFLHRNGSKDFEGVYTVHTGQGDLTEMGELKFWNGLNYTGYYEGECGRINGSTTDLFVPSRSPDEYITIFISDLCRIINLVPTGEIVVVDGIEGLKYETTPDTFDNGQQNPDMKCYCPTNLQPDNCPKTGVTHMGPCAKGAPMYISHSNFMWADPYYASTTTGLNSNDERDKFFFVMERTLGIPLQVKAPVQVSMHIQRDDDLDILSNIPDFYAPLFVTANQANITSELATDVKLVLMLPDLGFYIGVAFIVIGATMLLTGLILTLTHNWHGQKKENDRLIEEPLESAPATETHSVTRDSNELVESTGIHEDRTKL